MSKFLENLITFNRDENRPFMQKYLFDHIKEFGFQEKNGNFLNGQAANIKSEIKRYEQALAKVNIDLGLGVIGRSDEQVAVKKSISALTIGPATFMHAQKIIIVATGSARAEAVSQATNQSPSSEGTSSYLQAHPDVTFLLDQPAGIKLATTMFKAKTRDLTNEGPLEAINNRDGSSFEEEFGKLIIANPLLNTSLYNAKGWGNPQLTPPIQIQDYSKEIATVMVMSSAELAEELKRLIELSRQLNLFELTIGTIQRLNGKALLRGFADHMTQHMDYYMRAVERYDEVYTKKLSRHTFAESDQEILAHRRVIAVLAAVSWRWRADQENIDPPQWVNIQKLELTYTLMDSQKYGTVTAFKEMDTMVQENPKKLVPAVIAACGTGRVLQAVNTHTTNKKDINLLKEDLPPGAKVANTLGTAFVFSDGLSILFFRNEKGFYIDVVSLKGSPSQVLKILVANILLKSGFKKTEGLKQRKHHTFVDRAMSNKYGGIDFKASSMNIQTLAGGTPMDVHFDQAMVDEFSQGQHTGVRPMIVSMTQMQSVWPLLGLTKI